MLPYALLLAVLPTLRAEDARVLLLGNSYTSHNDLHILVADALEGTVPGWTEVYAQPLTQGGTTLAEHAARADGSSGDTPWRDALVTGPDAGSWDWVVLQDQSQVPGFPQSNSDWQASLTGALTLDGIIQAGGGETVFLLTWGRRDGDATNPARYPDYATMQAYLTEGYLAYAQACSEDGSQAWIIPAGHAWGIIHRDLEAAGHDPTDGDTAFTALYSEDGSHPSPAGSHLAALTAAAALTGRSVAGVPTPASVSEALAPTLRDAADRAVLDDPFGEIPYRWAFGWDAWLALGDDPADGVTISDGVMRPAVRLDRAEDPLPALTIGDGGGSGRLWVSSGGVLEVEQLEACEEGCVLTLDGGSLTIEQGSVPAVSHTSGSLTITGRLDTTADYTLSAGASLELHPARADQPLLVSEGHVVLAGDLRVAVDEVLVPTGSEVLLARARTITTDEVSAQLPEGASLELRADGEVQLLVLIRGGSPDSAPPDSAPGDSEPATPEEACGCSAPAHPAVALPWLLLASLALFRRRAHRSPD